MLLNTLIFTLLCACYIEDANAQCNYDQTMVVGKNYSVFSPNLEYNMQYTPGASCRWTARVPVGYKIVLNCRTFQLPDSYNCYGDRVTVSPTGDSTFSDGVHHCGTRPFFVTTYGNTISVALTSYPANNGGYFYCDMYAVQSCRCGWRKVTRIVGGAMADINEFPSMATLTDRNNNELFCGATIISERHALTAAHCLTNRLASRTNLNVGDHDLRDTRESSYFATYALIQFMINSAYSAQKGINDIAIVRTGTTIVFSLGVGPACLPFRFESANLDKRELELVGFGTTSFGGAMASKLSKVTVLGETQARCQLAYNNTIIDGQLCTYAPNKDACQFDSGGPVCLTLNGILFEVGIISAGSGCATSKPGINTRVAKYLNWIQSMTPEITYCRL